MIQPKVEVTKYKTFGFLLLVAFVVYLSIYYNFSQPSLFDSFSSYKTDVLKKTDKWIVVTSINHPTDDIKWLASLKEWTMVVVADTKTPKNWSLPGVHFLSIEKQLSLDLKLPMILSFKTYTRKMIGYVYAYVNGAMWIYDTDDDNKPYDRGLEQFDFEETVSGLRYTPRGAIAEKLFNSYRFLGYKEMWPRGFPLEYINEHTNGDDRLIVCRQMKSPAVQQGIVHKDPDVDAIYRLIHADKRTGLNVTFNKLAPPVLLEAGTYSPFNSQNTLFHRRAFFTMFLPTTVEFRVTDIWRSFFAQKLLHLIGENVAFYPVNAVQIRNSHDYLEDFKDEKAVYSMSGKIVQYIEGFNCSSTSIQGCVIELAEGFVKNEFFGAADLTLIKVWIEDLEKIGYVFPSLSNGTNMNVNVTEFRGNCRRANIDLPAFTEDGVNSRSAQKISHFNQILSWCEKGNESMKLLLPSAEKIELNHNAIKSLEDKKDTVVVIINNYPWKRSIGLFQRLYSPYFATIVFCGPWDPTIFLDEELDIIKPVNFVNLNEEEISSGALYHYCVSKVRDLRIQNVKGYYFLGDDTLFNFWHSLPTNVTMKSIFNYPDGAFWNMTVGEQAAKHFVNLMENKYSNDRRVQAMWKHYDEAARGNGFESGKEAMLKLTGRTISDLFYVTSKDFDFFSDMCEHLAETRMFVELALNKVFNVLETQKLDNYYQLGIGRVLDTAIDVYDRYNSNWTALHPVKLSFVLEHAEVQKRFCSQVMTTFHKHLFDFNQ